MEKHYSNFYICQSIKSIKLCSIYLWLMSISYNQVALKWYENEGASRGKTHLMEPHKRMGQQRGVWDLMTIMRTWWPNRVPHNWIKGVYEAKGGNKATTILGCIYVAHIFRNLGVTWCFPLISQWNQHQSDNILIYVTTTQSKQTLTQNKKILFITYWRSPKNYLDVLPT